MMILNNIEFIKLSDPLKEEINNSFVFNPCDFKVKVISIISYWLSLLRRAH